MRTVIFGADGLAFRIIHPLMEQGHMPNFKRLREQGCEAVLESKYPPLTPPAWTSLSTGLKPARHGVYDFWTYEEGTEQVGDRKAFVQTRRRGGKAIWNILSEYGKQVLVINVPITYPPEAVNGYMVSGYLTPSESVEFTYPASFKEELFQAVPDYEIDMNLREVFKGNVETRTDRLIDTVLQVTQKRIELIKYMIQNKPWDFCYAVFVGPDRLQHSLWDEITSLDPRTIEYYRMLDDALGLFLGQLGPDDALFVVSDHGFQGVSRYFDINEYLYSKGLLKLRTNKWREKASRKATLKHLLGRFGLLALARQGQKMLKSVGVIKKKKEGVYRPTLIDIDWEQSIAYVPSMSGFGGGYADIFIKPETDDALIAELAEDLKCLKDPKTGQPLVDAAYTTEVFGSGPYAPCEKHLLLLPTDGISFFTKLGNKWLWNDTRTGRSSKKRPGSHQKDGVFYACGAGLKQNFQAANAEVYDLVPTVLRSMGLPFPYEFDGKVIEDIFIEPQSPAQQATASTEGGLARRKLKKLLEV